MKGFDYAQSEVVVKTQGELDLIPEDYKGQIYIEGGVWYNKIKVGKRYYYRVIAWENSSVVARENSSVVARGNSSVVAWENSSVEARGNVQVVDYLQGAKIKISGNLRIVYLPKNIYEFMDFYGIKHTKTKATFYKAVHKRNSEYVSDYTSAFKYEVGKTHTEYCDADETYSCGKGLHVAYLDWALRFGGGWSDIAILEVETKIDDIIMPRSTDGKVRTSKLKVIREVPLEDCGVYGKIIARRLQNEKREN